MTADDITLPELQGAALIAFAQEPLFPRVDEMTLSQLYTLGFAAGAVWSAKLAVKIGAES